MQEAEGGRPQKLRQCYRRRLQLSEWERHRLAVQKGNLLAGRLAGVSHNGLLTFRPGQGRGWKEGQGKPAFSSATITRTSLTHRQLSVLLLRRAMLMLQ